MKKLLVAATLSSLVLSGAVSAQEKCGTDIAIQNAIAQNPQLRAKFEQADREIKERADAFAKQQSNNAMFKTTAGKYNVALVFHVVLSQAQIDEIGGLTGLSGVYARVTSQIEVLNKDYQGQNYNQDSAKIRPQFRPLFGNANMSFGLAHTKPDGSGTIGIELKLMPTSFTGYSPFDNTLKQNGNGGLSPWDNTRYLNIWITNITSGGGSGQILGYAYSPSYAAALGDPQSAGVVLDYRAFGKRRVGADNYFGNADQGRTMVHELGHYFTLSHIWGNVAVGSGDCTSTDSRYSDGIDDTPRQKDANQSFCPSGEKPNCAGTPGGEMYMNYMDYVNDACMAMFSKGQVTRMQSEFTPAGGSYQLQFQSALMNWPTGIAGIEINNSFDIMPNPTNGIININFAEPTNSLRSVTVFNTMGQQVKAINTTDAVSNLKIDISGMPAGVYTVNCRFDEGMVTRKIVLQ